MTFWTYMLQCADRRFYVGHTDNLERRLAQHQSGALPGYTHTRLPVHLVWSEEYQTRNEAREAERKLKGWGREKKLALIRGDWTSIRALARSGKREGRASTGSARTEFGAAAERVRLQGHPDRPVSVPLSIEVGFQLSGAGLQLSYHLLGNLDRIRIPAHAAPARRDELWRHTCFELFAAGAGEGYAEFNFSPSGEWAAYAFDGYRQGMRPLDTAAPAIRTLREDDTLTVEVEVGLPPGTTALGLTAVIEDADGNPSYWSLVHPPGKPDFHHRDCFALKLPPASAA